MNNAQCLINKVKVFILFGLCWFTLVHTEPHRRFGANLSFPFIIPESESLTFHDKVDILDFLSSYHSQKTLEKFSPPQSCELVFEYQKGNGTLAE